MHTHRSKCDNRKLNGHIEKIIHEYCTTTRIKTGHYQFGIQLFIRVWSSLACDNDLLNCILINLNYSN